MSQNGAERVAGAVAEPENGLQVGLRVSFVAIR